MKLQPQVLSRDEVRSLLDACPTTTAGMRDRAVFTTLYRGGTRISATLRIKPADIDWPRRLVTIHEDKHQSGRTVVLDAEAMDCLRAWSERRSALGINGRCPFFCATAKPVRGKALDSSQFRHKVKVLAAAAGIEKRVHLHAFRHTCASELLEEGFPLTAIAAQLGHKSVATTSRYLHILRPDLMNEGLRERKWDQ